MLCNVCHLHVYVIFGYIDIPCPVSIIWYSKTSRKPFDSYSVPNGYWRRLQYTPYSFICFISSNVANICLTQLRPFGYLFIYSVFSFLYTDRSCFIVFSHLIGSSNMWKVWTFVSKYNSNASEVLLSDFVALLILWIITIREECWTK